MLEHAPREVKIVEVGPRDGLQNEAAQVSTQDKVALIEALGQTGLSQIEITSFVSPKWIPQLADGPEVARLVKLPDSVRATALVPNVKGYQSAKAAGLKEIALFMSATESHSLKNINKSIADALTTLSEVAVLAKADGKLTRCYVSVVFACPYEGKVDKQKVVPIVHELLQMGVDEISLGDTVGHATANQVLDLLGLLKNEVAQNKIALHFHDTNGTALSNVLAGLDCGVKVFDSSLGGMGGCPYAPGAAGNLATEDLLYLLNGLGVKTGVDMEKLVDAGVLAESILKKSLPGRCLKAEIAKRQSGKKVSEVCH